MTDTATDTAAEQRRQQLIAELADHTIYELLGGADGLRTIVDRFYDLMDADAAYEPIRSMHQPDLGAIRTGLFEYLSGWLGGPQLYAERKGSPCIVGAHVPYRIDAQAADLWLDCMTRAMVDVDVPERYREVLLPPLGNITQALRNDDRPAPAGQAGGCSH